MVEHSLDVHGSFCPASGSIASSTTGTLVHLRRLWHRIALALLLTFAQHEALLHELQHSVDAVAGKADPASPLHEVCLKCVAFAGVDNAPATHVPSFEVQEADPPLLAVMLWTQRSAGAFSAYLSRAPPPNS